MVKVKTLEKLIKSTATFSDNGLYRYKLTRIWDENKKKATVIMLNPSKANELKTDKTVMNVTNFLIDNRYGGIIIVNLFSYMTTYPNELKNRNEDYEKLNEKYILEAFEEADTIIIAWIRNGQKYIKDEKEKIESKLVPYKNKTRCFVDGSGKIIRHPRDLGENWSLTEYKFEQLTGESL